MADEVTKAASLSADPAKVDATTLAQAVAAAPADLKNIAKKIPWCWMKDEKGNRSITTTIMWIAFVITTIAYALSVIPVITIHGTTIVFKAFDAGACAAYLGPLAALYFGRRMTERHFDAADAKTEDSK